MRKPLPSFSEPEDKTSRMMVTLTDDLIKILKRKSKETFGNRKGALSMYVEMLLRTSLGLSTKGVEEV